MQELDTEKEILKTLIRLANGTEYGDKNGGRRKLLSDHSYGVWSEKMVEIGRLIGGWITSVTKEKDSKND